jgi:hypothetical protein
MDMELRVRNHDIGLFFPTFQERINSTLPVAGGIAEVGLSAGTSAAPALEDVPPGTPHCLSNEEAQGALLHMEEEAGRRNVDIVQVHSGLNELRVARLLGLLELE